MWVKVIEDSKGPSNTQSGFISIECRNEQTYVELKNLLEKQNVYGYREVATFPWIQSFYYEGTIVDVKFT